MAITLVHSDHLLAADTVDVAYKFRGCLEVVFASKERQVFDGTVNELSRKYAECMAAANVTSVQFLGRHL